MSGEPRGKGLSLWLMPEGATRDRLAGLIERLAVRLGTTPFAPHLTLLSGVAGVETDVFDAARVLAAELGPLTVKPFDTDGHEAHFRCLFFRVIDSRALRDAHARAARSFGRQAEASFDPHLSLVYGTLAPELKSELARELSAESPAPFEVSGLHVWQTEGVAGEWRELAAFGFSGAAGSD